MIHLRLLLTCLLALWFSPSQAATLVATPSTFAATMAQARPGDTVRGFGDFGALTIKARSFDPPVTLIFGGQNGPAATATRLVLDHAVGVTVQGLAVVGTGKINTSAVSVGWSRGVRLERFDIRTKGPGNAVGISDSFDVTLAGSTVAGGRNCVGIYRTTGFQLLRLSITGCEVDGIDFSAAINGLVEDVAFRDFLRTAGKHQDAAQGVKVKNGLPPNCHIVFRRLDVDASVQGVFGEFCDLVVEDSRINTPYANAIAVVGDGVTVRNNRISTTLGSANLANIILGKSTNVTSCGNTIGDNGRKKGRTQGACQPPTPIQ